ncbi:3',5'-cyclic adenosine monophosphate phosphodiesterase CpdA [Labrys miyagiensis]|uniref:3',5'-cyclic adenosine monophosphate phosphodiesterase CpdA n=1 Tax=Labrys miyagiensis TaxID=346912 RepID=A0ABQ6CRC6_9HYPH|nr:phosphodiesterase [Labrys miyagiensis]GLS22685.1 3',5'-cyclic adenosine monophosphate phosphodiesterase CpdA [Labrys miyagiensis]
MLIAQLSDPHLRPKGVLYHGIVDSNAMFAAAIEHLNGLSPQPDLVLVSGDIVDEGAPAEYEFARELLSAIRQPLLVIPGNHDEREAFRRSFADFDTTSRSGPLHFAAGDFGPVRILGVDVTVPGLHHGDFDDDAAAWLEQQLAAAPGRPTIVMMHQPPFACGIPYVDEYWCRNGERLAALIARFPNVERIACGHVHRFMQLRFGGTLLCTAPSTTTAIALRFQADAEPASYLEPPAFLLHHWKEDAGLVTHLVPIGRFPGPFDFA